MTILSDLLAAIAADPADEAAALVLADWLLSNGDPRGELIIIEHRERTTPGGLRDPSALERLLRLVAELGFPRASNTEILLPFTGSGSFPEQYEVDFGGHYYYVRYRHHSLSITIDDGAIDSGVDYPDGFPEELGLPSSGEWSPEQTNVILTLISAAIRDGTPLIELQTALSSGIDEHPTYRCGSFPAYRLPEDFTAPRGIDRDQYGLAASDIHRWFAVWKRLRSMT